MSDDRSESLLQCVIGGEAIDTGDSGDAGDTGDAGDGGRLVEYYVKVMRLFEQVPSPSYVVRVAEVATSVVNREHPNAVCDTCCYHRRFDWFKLCSVSKI